MRKVVFLSIFALSMVLVPPVAQGDTEPTKVEENVRGIVKKASTKTQKEVKVLYSARVAVDNLQMYASSSKKSKKRKTIKREYVVQVVKVSKSWSQIQWGYMTGWVESKGIRRMTEPVFLGDNYYTPLTKEIVVSNSKVLHLKRYIPDVAMLNYIYTNQPMTHSVGSGATISTLEEYIRWRDMMFPHYIKKETFENEFPVEEWEAEYQKLPKTGVLQLIPIKQTFQNGKVVFVDEIAPTSKIVDDTLKEFGKQFASSLEGFTQEEKLHVLYDYIYYQFIYAGDYSTKMVDRYTINTQLGSNGLVWMFYHMANESGLDVTIKKKGNAFYMIWVTDKGETVTLDIASDMKEKSKHGATKGLKDKKAFLNVEKTILK